MTIEELSWEWHRLILTNKLSDADGDAFENIFQLLAKARWGILFTPTIPMGSRGDLKCDGFRSDIGAVYQCYGPRYGQVNVNDALSKIEEDFNGAKDHWKGELKKWFFVVGVYRNKVPSEIVRKVAEMATQHAIPAEIMTREEILEFAKEIDEVRRNQILGPIPSSREMAIRVTYKNIGRALTYIRAAVFQSPVQIIPLPPDIDRKASYNMLSDAAKAFIEVGRAASGRVQSYLLTHVQPSDAEEMAQGFTGRYKEVVSQGAEPSEAFQEMVIFAGGATGDPDRDGAALAIVAHFFSTCEIFDSPPMEQRP